MYKWQIIHTTAFKFEYLFGKLKQLKKNTQFVLKIVMHLIFNLALVYRKVLIFLVLAKKNILSRVPG